MKRTVLRILLVIILFVGYKYGYAGSTTGTSITNALPTEPAYYKQLYENERDTNNKLLTVTYAAIAIIIALVILFMGGSLFTNYRNNRAQTEIMHKSIDTKIEEVEKNIIKMTQKKIDDFTKVSKNELDRSIRNSKVDLENSSNKHEKNTNNIINNYNIFYTMLISQINQRIETLEEKLQNLQSTQEQNEGNITAATLLKLYSSLIPSFEATDDYLEALNLYIDKTVLALETLNNYTQASIDLIHILELLKKLHTLPHFFYSKLLNMLDKLPDSISLEAQGYKEQIISLAKQLSKHELS